MGFVARLRLSFKYKLLLGIALSLCIVFGIGGTVAGWLVQERLVLQARMQMEVAGQGIHAMVRALINNSVKNYLKGLAEANLAYVRHVHGRYQAGEISEAEAMALAETFLLTQKIGASGYVTAVDAGRDGGRITLAVHPFQKGRDITDFAFARRMADQKNGYMEFEWKNPGDASVRLKAQWMSYFEPWRWIINAAPFRDEYRDLVDLANIETELAKVRMDGAGYAYIMDMDGTLLAHPEWKGRNMLTSTDAHTGAPFVRQMIDGIRTAIAEGRGDGQSGNIQYAIRSPEGDRVLVRMMNYRYVPEVNWIVGVVTDLDQLEAPLVTVRHTQLVVMMASMLFAMLVIVWAVRPMTRSIADLAAAVERIDRGHLDTPLPAAGKDEIGMLASAFNRMAERLSHYTDDLERQVAERTAALEQANGRLEELSNTDGLTALANRRRFDQVLAAEWSRARRCDQPLMLALLDVDHFKAYNDHYGHQAGDECLQAVGTALQSGMRRSTDLPARYGGEEFAVIAPNTSPDQAAMLAERIRAAIADLAIPHQGSAHGRVTVSIGIAMRLPGDCHGDAATLVRMADQALYRAKGGGRNRVVTADCAAQDSSCQVPAPSV